MIGARRRRRDYLYARGEIYRLRGADGDLDAALADYQAAARAGGEPPETHRGLGIVLSRAQADAGGESELPALPGAGAEGAGRGDDQELPGGDRSMRIALLLVALLASLAPAAGASRSRKVESGDAARSATAWRCTSTGAWNHVNAPGIGPGADLDHGGAAGRPAAALRRRQGRRADRTGAAALGRSRRASASAPAMQPDEIVGHVRGHAHARTARRSS